MNRYFHLSLKFLIKSLQENKNATFYCVQKYNRVKHAISVIFVQVDCRETKGNGNTSLLLL